MSLVDSPISRITIRRVDPYGIPMSRKGALIALPTTWEQLIQIACKELIGEEGPTLPTTRIYLFEGPRTRLDAHGLGIGGQLYPHTWHLVRDRDILDVEFVNYTGPSKPPKSDVAGAPTTTSTTTTTTSPATITTTSVTIEPSQPTESTSIRDTEMTDASITATTTATMETSLTPATTTDTTTSTSSAISTEPATTTSTSPASATTEAAPATTPATSTTSAAATTTSTTTTEPVPIHSIEVSVRDADSSLEPTFFKVHRRKPLNKLMRAYCTHVGVDIKDVRFEYQGIILQPTHTCDTLEMQEGAEIVMIHNAK